MKRRRCERRWDVLTLGGGGRDFLSLSPPPPSLGNEAYFAIVGEERGEGGTLDPSPKKGNTETFWLWWGAEGDAIRSKNYLENLEGQQHLRRTNERNSDRNRQFCPPHHLRTPPPLLATPYHACTVRRWPVPPPEKSRIPNQQPLSVFAWAFLSLESASFSSVARATQVCNNAAGPEWRGATEAGTDVA